MPLVAAARMPLAGEAGPDGYRVPLSVVMRQSIRPAGHLAAVEAGRLLVWLPMLADRALVTVDALARAVFRMAISHRNILQWTPAGEAGRIEPGLAVLIRRLWPSCAVAAILGVTVGSAGPDKLAWAAPFLATWLAAPALAYLSARQLAGKNAGQAT